MILLEKIGRRKIHENSKYACFTEHVKYEFCLIAILPSKFVDNVIYPRTVCVVYFLNVPLCQFHQRFTCPFFVQTSFRQLFSNYMYIEKSWVKHFRTKIFRITCWWNWPLVDKTRLTEAGWVSICEFDKNADFIK